MKVRCQLAKYIIRKLPPTPEGRMNVSLAGFFERPVTDFDSFAGSYRYPDARGRRKLSMELFFWRCTRYRANIFVLPRLLFPRSVFLALMERRSCAGAGVKGLTCFLFRCWHINCLQRLGNYEAWYMVCFGLWLMTSFSVGTVSYAEWKWVIDIFVSHLLLLVILFRARYFRVKWLSNC